MSKKKWFLGCLGLFALFFACYVVIQYFVIGPTVSPFVKGKTNDFFFFPYHPWIYLLYVHIIFGLIALLLGPLQFIHKIRQKSINTHKLIGKIYVLSIFISSCIGLYLSYYATGGWVSVIGFYSLTVAWMYTTVVGFLMIRKGNIKKHKQWMMRSYAVTLTFVTFRIWSLLVLLITQERGVLYGLTIIFSWVLNLLIVEWMFFKTLNGCKR